MTEQKRKRKHHSRRGWKEWEDNYLKKNYNSKNNSSLSRTLKRSKSSIIARAKKLNLIDYNPELWTEEEKNSLREMYKDENLTIEKIAERLNKSRSAVVWQSTVLNIKRPERGHEWTENEVQYLIDNYKTKTHKEIAKHLNFTDSSVSHKLYRLGLKIRTKGRPWKEEEKEFIKQNYKKIPTKEIAQQLNRTVNSIITVVGKLGVSDRRPRPWTDEEKEFLKNNYNVLPSEEIAEKLNRSLVSIKSAYLIYKKKDKE